MKKINKNFNLRSALLAFLCFGLMGTVMADNEYDLVSASIAVAQSEYDAGTTQTFNVSVTFDDDGTAEFVDYMEFATPAGWTVSGGTFTGTASFCGLPSFSIEGGNAVFGINYPVGNTGCGPFSDADSPHTFEITYIIPAAASGDVTISVDLVGDGFLLDAPSTISATSAPISLAGPAAACILTCPDPIVAANPLNECGVELSIPDPTTTDGCVVNEATAEVVVSILADSFGGETSWEITDDNNGGAVIASDATITSNALNEETVEVACGGSYTFTIFDSFGDGICCGFGNGSYTLTVEGTEVASGGEFGASEATTFGTVCQPAPATAFTNDFNGEASIVNGLFPIGETTVIYTAFDAEGNQSACSTTVTVADPVFTPGAIGCLAPGGHVTLSEENCDAIVSAGDLLQGTDYGCADFYDVGLFYDEAMTQPLNNNLDNDAVGSQNVDEEIYAVVTSPTGTSCWTTIIPEDKTPPVLECPCDLEEFSTIEGEITGESEFYTPPSGVINCAPIGLGPIFQYDANSIQVSADDSYTVEVTSFENAPFLDEASVIFLYEGSFNPDNACENLVTFGFGDIFVGSASLTFDGVAGQNYVVVFTPNFAGEVGPYTLEITGAAGGSAVQQDENCVLSCTQVEDLLDGTIAGPVATATDACGPVTVEKVDEFIDNDCGDDIVRRTYTATDESGNTATCTYDIIIDQPDADEDVEFPVSLDGLPGNLAPLQCDAGFATDANGAPSPTVSGFPQIAGSNIMNGGSCDIAATYNDVVVEICEGTTKYYRTWTIVGWCPDFTGPLTGLQIIKVVDDKGPTIAGIPSGTVMIGTVSTDCSGAYVYPTFVATDNCDAGPIAVSVSASAGTENAAGTAVFGLPLGLTTITVTATDDCGNTTTETYQVEVKDDTPPTMSCETFRTVGLTFDEPSLVDAIAFDDGSTDNCAIDIYEVRRMDNPNCPGFDGTPYQPKAPFYCCDVGGPNVMVELRITDVAGNSNSCMVEVEVQDKLDPVITCPADKIIDCIEDPFAGFGEATAIDNCSTVITDFYSGTLDNCGEGTIFRFFTATDPGGRTDQCVQTISVVNSDPFCIVDTEPWTALNSSNPECQDAINSETFDGHTSNDDVEWPADITLDGCGFGLLPDDLEANSAVNPNNVRPRIFEDECDLVGVTFDDTELPITDGACRKVLRLWKVYDWCTFDENNFDPNDPDTGFDFGYYEYVQIIKVIDNDGPVITSSCEDVSFCSFDPNCSLGTATLLLSATDECTADGDLNYSYVIDAFNDGGNDIPGTGSDASGNYPIGTHKITWTVEDGCGNVSTCNYLFVISDCKAPTPNLLNGIATDLMENCEIEIWADDWDNPASPSFDNCGIEEWVVYSPSLGPGQVTPPAAASFGWTFTSVGTQTVDVWIKDVNGNWAYVSTYILIQDNVAPFCNGQSAGIAGTIENEEASEVMDVMVNIDGDVPGIPDGQMTGATGEYAFPGLAVGQNYTVTPEKDGDYLNGVTTFDLVLMSKHILNVEQLNSPYKMIAADINKSGTITTFDMVELRKLILFIDTEFQNNTSWRFVDAEFVFPDASNPFTTSFPEVFNVNDLQDQEIGDFVAVKVGDVNCSAQVNPFAGSGDDRSANGELVFGVQDQAIEAGETYTVDFTAADFAEVLGYQFTLAFDNNTLEFVDVSTSLDGLTEGNFGMSLLNEGVITTSWNTTNAVSLDADAKVFSLTFVAKSNAQLSDVLAVNSRYTKAEAYDNDVNLMEIGLSFNGGTAVSGAFELYQNQPNPFKDETTIGFNMPEAGFASLTIYDVSGKLLHRVEGEYAQGFNQVSLNRSDLAATGVVYYQLDTENDSATKKMILIK